MSVPLLELKGAAVRYAAGSGPVFEGVDFALFEGERLALTGDNGSGKTTLLLALTGLRPLAAGTLFHRGREVVSKKDLKTLRRDVGLVFQNADDQLFSPTVLEDVAFGPLNLGAGRDEALERALAALERLGVADLADQGPHRLSGGQRRMAALAASIVMEPSVLLLDEPTNDLDAKGRIRLAEALNNESMTLLIAGHDMDFLSVATVRTLHMAQGGFVAEEGPAS